MKVGIVTFHRAINYGAVLQAFALRTCIEEKGMDCEIIDYRSTYLEKYYKSFLLLNTSLKGICGSILNAPIRWLRKKAFKNFREKYLIFSRLFTEDTIKEANEEYDLFVFGSDQVWNCSLTNNDFNFLGKFVAAPEKLYSYAASFGQSAIPGELNEAYHLLLSRYQKAGVREDSGRALYEKLTGKASETVMDPVFLLDREHWTRLASEKSEHGKYILLYHLQGSRTKASEYAYELSQRTGFPIVDMQAWVKMYPLNVRPRYCDSPNDFLGWIKDAEYIVTDSFHCTAFSVIFEKKFWSRIDPSKKVRETRVGNLLFQLGLEGRIAPDNIDDWKCTGDLSYCGAREAVKKRTVDSIAFISSILVLKA